MRLEEIWPLLFKIWKGGDVSDFFATVIFRHINKLIILFVVCIMVYIQISPETQRENFVTLCSLAQNFLALNLDRG